jgi:hypothetical protein
MIFGKRMEGLPREVYLTSQTWRDVMNIYSKLALATAQSSVLLATSGILGITPPAVASSLKFEVSGNLIDFPSRNPPVVGTFTGTFSYDPEAADLIPEPSRGVYPISEFSIIFRNLLGSQIDVVDSDDETCNCFRPEASLIGNDDDYARLEIIPNDGIGLSFIDNDFVVDFSNVRSRYILRRVSLSFDYEGDTDALPSTTEEFLANLGNFSRSAFNLPIYYTDISGLSSRTFLARNITINSASQSVPEPSGVGSFSLISLGFFLKKKKTSSRKAIAIAKI